MELVIIFIENIFILFKEYFCVIKKVKDGENIKGWVEEERYFKYGRYNFVSFLRGGDGACRIFLKLR